LDADAGIIETRKMKQQWTFSPPGAIRETEEYDVDLLDVTVLELRILPDQGGGAAAHRSPVCVWPDKWSLPVAEPERRKKGANNG
jgi:hypothetical protein